MYIFYNLRTAIGLFLWSLTTVEGFPFGFLTGCAVLIGFLVKWEIERKAGIEIAVELKALELAKLLVELEQMDTALEALEAAKIALGEEIKIELKAIDPAKQLIKLEAIDAEKAEIAEANKKMWDWVNARVEATTPECEKKWARK